ncbi:MAG: hypothetical protein UX38_C0002G0015 [Microgenomates group bacterium GW2011_GWC1_46_16]|uniref:HD domain-containing protein n=2 Tax=Candidatus Collieribacteriota TaxID=1752725 RepID=A0A1F5FZV0_9BACT|nr:MAG: hypothetical protein UX32_C0001G0106 [Microgenomates group bacterium GW2011_GWF1_46_12]KKU26835.1 MAG: hypothetical protein UX38_C0002G0015 [Microgenomates group bacterium GW2011_GWC1_46_16]KKU28251.1 MAG: hypothetical protein UX40_C0001G0014 [Microgenomates group bacterium GW2011_GWF2_46_18]KKU45259.1 MAG: hypothetical protein UX63_C0009G0023 [Microgenomates group bacterium GW2011_GWB1_46_7]KKU60374.1 MAG: hypothetical protein UX82_C0013G0011 [Microgenomates group bacterium GW2011_GWE1
MLVQIEELYQKYHNMPQLVTHQLRVGAVGRTVAKHWKSKCDPIFITQLCLIHDIGNIVKFDLTNPNFGKIENIEEWKKIQKQYRAKYGENAQEATRGILQEAGLNQFTELIAEEEKLYFAEAKEAELERASTAAIILMYADCRVTPKGVVSYRERIDDLKERYGGVASPTWYAWTYWFEEWIQKQVTIDLHSITESQMAPLFTELLTSTI